MNDCIVDIWNINIDDPKDKVYVIGDFIFSDTTKYINEIVNRLKGEIHLVPGNHDESCLNKLDKAGIIIERDVCQLQIDDTHLSLCHYPMETWNRKHYGAIHIHGHMHSGKRQTGKQRVEVGWDSWYDLVSLYEIKKALEPPKDTWMNDDDEGY